MGALLREGLVTALCGLVGLLIGISFLLFVIAGALIGSLLAQLLGLDGWHLSALGAGIGFGWYAIEVRDTLERWP